MMGDIIQFVNKYGYVFIYLLVINILAFIMYFIDKQKAKKHRYRISEAALIAFAVFGGSIGALFGMYIFRHKTKKPKFYIGVPMILVLQIILIIVIYNR